MKTRQGFVSNSSSSSFLIYGTYLPTGIELAEMVLASDRKEEFLSQLDLNTKLSPEEARKLIEGDREDYEISEAIEEISDLSCEGQEKDCWGICPTEMEDNETMGQFKKRVEEEFRNTFNFSEQLGWQEEAYYDG